MSPNTRRLQEWNALIKHSYQRVVVCVLESRSDGERRFAKRILGLIMCAARPLMWKEIQSFFCIEPVEGRSDPDFRLRHSCKYYCGSLVETGHNVDSVYRPDEAVDLVHETARM